jgi:hypothetical protein
MIGAAEDGAAAGQCVELFTSFSFQPASPATSSYINWRVSTVSVLSAQSEIPTTVDRALTDPNKDDFMDNYIYCPYDSGQNEVYMAIRPSNRW